jgi:mono/diheme cytochrome c family protein
MKIFLKVILVIVILAVLVFGGILIYVKTALPDVGPAPDLKVEITPERLERGEYLAYNITMCIDCHSTRDWNKFSGPPVDGTHGQGGEIFSREMGFPGTYYASNITPSGIGDWTDGELFRAITAGVNKEGKALFPVMPYPYFGKMDIEDVYSIIAYIRTLKPIENTVPASESDFPFNFIINLIPQKPDFQTNPSESDKIAYVEILSMACMECHTQVEKGQVIPELAYSGGRGFPLPTGGTVYSSNITPDMETGIGRWTEQQFIDKFKSFGDSSYVAIHIAPNTFNTIMPWEMLGGMTESDLSAVYAYLKKQKPIRNEVVKFVAD